jgi:hypothetical protein
MNSSQSGEICSQKDAVMLDMLPGLSFSSTKTVNVWFSFPHVNQIATPP